MPVEPRHVAVECYGGGESGDIGTHISVSVSLKLEGSISKMRRTFRWHNMKFFCEEVSARIECNSPENNTSRGGLSTEEDPSKFDTEVLAFL